MIETDARLRTKLVECLRAENAAPNSRLSQAEVVFQQFSSPTAAVEALSALISVAPHLFRHLSRFSDASGLVGILAAEIAPTEHSERIAAYWKESLAAAQSRLALEGSDNPMIRARFRLKPRPGPAVPDCGWVAIEYVARPNRIAEAYDMLWFETDRLPTLLLRSLVDMAGYVVLVDVDAPPDLPKTRMATYHPERVRLSRPFLKKVGPLQVLNGSAAATSELMDELKTVHLDVLHAHHLDFPVVLRDKYPERLSVTLSAEAQLELVYLAFRGAGREIFDLPPRLVEMMMQSDAGEIAVAQLQTPYAAQYLHFGRREDLVLASEWYCDGAYVLSSDGALEVWLVGGPDHLNVVNQWMIRPEPVFSYRFEKEDASQKLDTAIEVALDRDTNRRDTEHWAFVANAEAFARERGLTRDEVVERASAVKARLDQRTNESRVVAHRALSLVVNALCYLTAYPDDHVYVWPEGTPGTLRMQSDNGTTKVRDRASRELAAQGFSKVRMFGMHFRSDEGVGSSPSDATVRPHWRRGHWRNQVHGQGRALRRLVWIMPMLIHAERVLEDDIPGHVYRPTGEPQLTLIRGGSNDAPEAEKSPRAE